MSERNDDIELSTFVGPHDLSGVDFGHITEKAPSEWASAEQKETMTFILDGVTYRAIEDPSDGYRNGLERVIAIEEPVANTFAPVPVVGVHRQRWTQEYEWSGSWSRSDDVIELRDATTNLVVLEFGTTDIDDYYPSYVAFFSPENMAVNQPSPEVQR